MRVLWISTCLVASGCASGACLNGQTSLDTMRARGFYASGPISVADIEKREAELNYGHERPSTDLQRNWKYLKQSQRPGEYFVTLNYDKGTTPRPQFRAGYALVSGQCAVGTIIMLVRD